MGAGIELVNTGDKWRSKARIVDGVIRIRYALKVDRGRADELREDGDHLLRQDAEALLLIEAWIGPVIGNGANLYKFIECIGAGSRSNVGLKAGV